MNKKLTKKEAGAVNATVAQAEVKAKVRSMKEFQGEWVITALPKSPNVQHNCEWQEFVDGRTVSEYKTLEKSPIENTLAGLRHFVRYGFVTIGPVNKENYLEYKNGIK